VILQTYQSPEFVLASVLIAVMTAYVAIETSSRIREYGHGDDLRLVWLSVSALCLGGGIWSMHFVAMLGYVTTIAIGYNIALTALSLLVPIVIAGVGFHFAATTPVLSWWRTSVIGTIYGMAIVAMHYTGMAAMRMEATIDWNLAYVLASVVVAIVASTAAIRAAFMRLSFLPTVVGSVLMGLAISGMHYTAMCAVTLIGAPGVDVLEMASVTTMTRGQLASGVTIVAFVVLMGCLMASAYDRRRSGRG
jgi:NO-binding membrane sensor protein with MHYT domain